MNEADHDAMDAWMNTPNDVTHFQRKPFELDLVTLLIRLVDDWDGEWRSLSHMRIYTCDLPRLGGYLSPEAQALLSSSLKWAALQDVINNTDLSPEAQAIADRAR
jgi:hypothetical protein